MRAITTGWRHWSESVANVALLRVFMYQLVELLEMSNEEELQLVHGGAPGADTEIQAWWETASKPYNNLKISLPPPIVFQADWERYGAAAGPLRNAQMVTAGANLCVAFVHPQSKGTIDCRDKARRAGIFTLQVDWMEMKEVASGALRAA
jgi:hypothetical protein